MMRRETSWKPGTSIGTAIPLPRAPGGLNDRKEGEMREFQLLPHTCWEMWSNSPTHSGPLLIHLCNVDNNSYFPAGLWDKGLEAQKQSFWKKHRQRKLLLYFSWPKRSELQCPTFLSGKFCVQLPRSSSAQEVPRRRSLIAFQGIPRWSFNIS